MRVARLVTRAWLTLVCMLCGAAALAAEPSPHAIDIPPWFKDTFLDIREDIRDASRQGKRLMLYFGQDGCPYCRRLMQVNFTQKDIVDRTRQSIYPLALNMWGDRDVTWLDGKSMSEKTLAAALKVQFTPTLLFFDESGSLIARINGYYPPNRFRAAIEYVAGKMEKKQAFAEYMRTAVKEQASGALHAQPFFLPAPLDLTRAPRMKPLAIFFEQPHCEACDEMHAGALRAPGTRLLLNQFDVARIDLFGKAAIVAPDGRRTTESALAALLAIAYTPSVVLFSTAGKELLRIEGYVRTLHLQSALDYVASGAYTKQPSFQRYLQARAERLRQQGEQITIW